MSHSVTVKLNKAANEFNAGESIGFNIRGGVQYYDRKTKQKEWTNYSAVIFTKNSKQIDFYRQALIEGAIVELGGKQLKIDTYNDNHTIELLDAWVGSINQSVKREANQGNQQAPQNQGHQAQQQSVNQGGQNNGQWGDDPVDIPF